MNTITEIIYDNIDFNTFPFDAWEGKARVAIEGSKDLHVSFENLGYEYSLEFDENTPSIADPFGAIFQTLSDSAEWVDIAKQVCSDFSLCEVEG
ncbi:hypothetical protein [Maridesulfovibrio frigidus]|uniref:hypothetical protein n=1 Tax=Maridesulfovibrio frigidus TaxID=340956 RepID=UPI0004E2345A|nr:hypothetical protein [Maridesulfovibrio frigidus]